MLTVHIPFKASLFFQQMIRTELTRFASAIHNFIAFTSLILITAGCTFTGLVHIINFMGSHIRNIDHLFHGIQNIQEILFIASLRYHFPATASHIQIHAVSPTHLFGILRRLYQKILFKCFCRNRRSKQESLHLLRSHLFQDFQFFLTLHTFAADLDIQTSGKLDHISNQAVIIIAILDLADETAVYLNFIHFKALQISQ